MNFLNEWYGILAFVLFDAVALIAAIAITYRWLFKRILDFLFAGLCILLLSPIYLAFLFVGLSQKKQGKIDSLITKKLFVGKREKEILLHFYTTETAEEKESGFCKFLLQSGWYKLPLLWDVFLGRLSFVGCKAFRPSEHFFLDEVEKDRTLSRPGLINPLVLSGDKHTDYQEMLISDKKYAWRFSLGKDFRIFFAWLLCLIRGEQKEVLGITIKKPYTKALLDEGKISKEDYEKALLWDAVHNEKEKIEDMQST